MAPPRESNRLLSPDHLGIERNEYDGEAFVTFDERCFESCLARRHP
jgi:hypothetical protein